MMLRAASGTVWLRPTQSGRILQTAHHVPRHRCFSSFRTMPAR